ncbi:ribonuclease E/G [Butyrivibrio sp. VCD2006]|uniref:ribonuclease E/G n=1 Tax=Butyrivibrio sp. VCD2006 TaxID=1280664 RepID=UPI000411047A|nr:ribonuclease E/G [Butyrivibrio sp. VCD2006]
MSEIIITRWHEHLSLIGLIDNKVEVLDILDSVDRTGNIYVGRVDNLVSNLNAAFVRFDVNSGKHGIGFLPLKSLPPEYVLNRQITSSSELRPGDIVLVQLKVEEQKMKQARLSGKIDLKDVPFSGDLDDLLRIAKTRSEHQLICGTDCSISESVKSAIEIVGDIASVTTDVNDVYDELMGNGIDCTLYNEEEKRIPLQIFYSLTSKTDDLFKKKVWLDSGAFLIIEQTETLNLIDVNSGKAIKKSDEFFLKLNKEAALEAYRQIRLRNLSGMILIDFVSMKKKEKNEELIQYIKEIIASDPMNLSYIDLTGLGIMEFTRQKSKKSLRETIDIKNM